MSQNAQRISMKPVQSLLCCGVAEFREQLQPRSSLSPKISRQTRYPGVKREPALCGFIGRTLHASNALTRKP